MTAWPSLASASARSRDGRPSPPRSAVVLGLLEDQGGIAGAIFGRLLAIGWSLITFLAVPVIALEGTGPFETLKRSAGLFRDRWGQQVTGDLAIGGAVALLGVLQGAVLITGGIAIWASSSFAGAVLVIVGVIVLAVALVFSGAKRDLRRGALPLRARRPGCRRLQRQRARIRGADQGRPGAVDDLRPGRGMIGALA